MNTNRRNKKPTGTYRQVFQKTCATSQNNVKSHVFGFSKKR